MGKKKKDKVVSADEVKVTTKSKSGFKTKIQGYGYNYSVSKYVLTAIAVLSAMVIISYFYELKLAAIIALAVLALLMLPSIILSQYRYLYNNGRFEQLVDYMEQMIISFKQNPKILYALESCTDIVEGEIKTCVEEAINIITTDTTTENVYEKALGVIEKQFPNSRLRTLHRFLINVENVNSVAYQESIDTLYFDIRSWVTRVYSFQKQIANMKSKLSIIMGLSLLVAAAFVQIIVVVENSLKNSTDPAEMDEMFGNPDMFTINVTGHPISQITSILFIGLFILMYMIMCSRIHGNWLVNDLSKEDPDRLYKEMDYIVNFDGKKSLKTGAVLGVIIGGAFAVLGFIIWKPLALLGLAMFFILMFKGHLSYKSKKKHIEKELIKEFPVWMRDVAINLNNMVVVKAIEDSKDTASPVIKPFITHFLEEIEKDPVSIRPYKEFLGIYSISEINTAIKILYSVKMLNKDDAQRQINDLISRNQILLEESEQMKNDDALSGVSAIALIPMLLMIFKLLADMMLLMISLFGMIGSF